MDGSSKRVVALVSRPEKAAAINPAVSRRQRDCLGGLDVLIDSHDLSLPKGTGIKSYGLNLISALQSLGASPELLVSAPSSGNAVIARSVLYDPARRRERNVRGRKILKQWWHLSRNKAGYVPANGNESSLPIPNTVFPYGLGCSSLFNCYLGSHAVQQRFGKIPSFSTTKKYRIWHATTPLPLRHREALQITTIHDLIPILQPHLCDHIRPAFYQCVEAAVRDSRAIAVVSEYTKNDLLKYFDVPEEKVFVTYQYSSMSRERLDDRKLGLALKTLGLEPGKYILYVGTLETRKNIRGLLHAYLMLGCDVPLVLAGKPGQGVSDDLKFIRRMKPEAGRDVRLLDFIPQAMMPAVYQGASCLAFPSLYEGFGLPVLEAMASGCPVVCSETTSLPEVGGNAAHYVDPFDEESISHGLGKVLGDTVYRQTLIERGYERAAYFSPEKFADQIAGMYCKVLS